MCRASGYQGPDREHLFHDFAFVTYAKVYHIDWQCAERGEPAGIYESTVLQHIFWPPLVDLVATYYSGLLHHPTPSFTTINETRV